MASHPDFEALAAWWLGELAAAEAEALEAHLFECAACARRGEALAALAGGIRAAVRGNRFRAVISASFLEMMKAQGMRLREYAVEPGGRVSCTIRAEDDAVVSRLRAPLAGVKRLDVLQRVVVRGAEVHASRIEDVPFDPVAGEVLHVPLAGSELKKMPDHVATTTLVAVDEQGERRLGEYTFVHSAS